VTKRKAKKANTTSELQLDFQRKITKNAIIAQTITVIVNNLIKYGSFVAISYILYLCIESLSGKTTDANLIMNIIGDVKINKWLYLLFGGGSIIYGISERNLRRKTIKRMNTRLDNLERRINPKKQSSHITPEGKTNRGDLP